MNKASPHLTAQPAKLVEFGSWLIRAPIAYFGVRKKG